MLALQTRHAHMSNAVPPQTKPKQATRIGNGATGQHPAETFGGVPRRRPPGGHPEGLQRRAVPAGLEAAEGGRRPRLQAGAWLLLGCSVLST